MLLKNTFIAFFLFITLFAIGKEGLGPSFEKLKKRTLLVVFTKESEKYTSMLSKKGKLEELETYRAELRKEKECLQKTFQKFWKLSSEVKYVSVDSAEILLTAKPDAYAYAVVENTSKTAGSRFSDMPLFAANYRVLRLFINEGKEEKLIGQCRLGMAPTLGNYVYAVMRLNDLDRTVSAKPESRQTDVYGIGYEDSEANAHIMKNLTLISKKGDCDEDFNLDDIKKHYPYAVKIVSDEEWDNAMFNQKEDVVCAVIVIATVVNTGEGGGFARGKTLMFQNAVHPKTGYTLCYGMSPDLISSKVLSGFKKIIEKK